MNNSKLKPKLIIWMNMPSHHQSEYFFELSKQCHLKVFYLNKQDERRKTLGWQEPELKYFEQYCKNLYFQLFMLFKHRNEIHVITGCGNISNIFTWLFCRLFRVKWCHLSENISNNPNRSFFKNVIIKEYYKSVSNRALCAFAIGNKAKRSFIELGIEPSKIFITNYSSAINDDLTSKTTVSSPIKAIVLGEICLHKGSDILLENIEIFSDKLNVDFYGSVKDENKNFITKINLKKNTRYLGVVNSNSINSLLSEYDLLIFPSRVDGWGMAVHEAISNNTPVICSVEAGCSEHLIIDGFNGYLITPDQNALQQAINRYIKNPNLLLTHSANCSEHKKLFSPFNTAKVFLNNLIKSMKFYD